MTTLESDTQFSFDLLAGALTGREAARATGTLHVVGNPGGRIHLRNGWIISAESAGAPGPDTLLLRSGRISESALPVSDNAGTTALHVVAMMAAQDAVFSAVAGEIENCVLTADTLDVAVPMSTGLEPVRLLQETSRRLTSLTALPCPLSPHRERVAPTPEAELHEHSGPCRHPHPRHRTALRPRSRLHVRPQRVLRDDRGLPDGRRGPADGRVRHHRHDARRRARDAAAAPQPPEPAAGPPGRRGRRRRAVTAVVETPTVAETIQTTREETALNRAAPADTSDRIDAESISALAAADL
ncbi:hypothetical protein ABZ345_37920 [Lentzea sp. NPDC005914]|uniref:hypothetical protein n=1 Tax=Lentzea sp. NPDC005914 TaxID=3154572 RepID=UPI0033CF8651